MKKIILTSIAVVATVMTINAQDFSWGVKAGVGMSNTKITAKDLSLSINPGTTVSYLAGFVGNYELNSKWGLQAEILYNNDGFDLCLDKSITALISDMMDMELPSKACVKVAMNSVRVPVMAKYALTDDISVMFGGYVGFRTGLGLSLNDDTKSFVKNLTSMDVETIAENIVDDNIKSIDYGALLGAEYSFANGLFIDARYNLGLSNLFKNDISLESFPGGEGWKINLEESYGVTARVKTSSLQISVGYRF